MELSAKDLRIGNKIGIWYKDEYKNIHEVEPTTFYMINGDIDSKGFYFKAIPLTEDWLLKADGYWEDIISEKDAFLIDIHEELSIGWCGYLFLVISGCIIQINDTNSIYVHQLQNLYSDLKGEELTFKND